MPSKKHSRKQDWDTRLHDFLAAKQGALFAWGRNDCCLFACDAIKAMTGLDPARGQGFRGKYSTQVEALRLLKKWSGVEGVAERRCRELGFVEIQMPYAGRGDLVLLGVDKNNQAARETGQLEGSQSLGVCMGIYSFFVQPVFGLQEVETKYCRRAWRII